MGPPFGAVPHRAATTSSASILRGSFLLRESQMPVAAADRLNTPKASRAAEHEAVAGSTYGRHKCLPAMGGVKPDHGVCKPSRPLGATDGRLSSELPSRPPVLSSSATAAGSLE